jgi:hypothetical protein
MKMREGRQEKPSAWRWTRAPSTRWRRASSSRSPTISFKGEGADAGVNGGRHWRHASQWFSYQLNDPGREAKVLRLTLRGRMRAGDSMCW